jgi:class 3 adenylate cyclase
MAVGIASGRVIAGYFGTSSHRDFAAAGSAVAEAFALEHECHDGEIIVSRNAHAELQQWWPSLWMSAADFKDSSNRVHFGYRIDGRKSYPKPVWLHHPDIVSAL